MSRSIDALRVLARFRNDDGGFGLHPGQPSEPEPTAMAAIALDDDEARGWLVGHQRDNGSFGVVGGPFADDASTPLAALALPDGAARESALDHVESERGRRTSFFPEIPLDPSIPGWPWTDGTASWVEPSARALWALRLHRPSSPRIGDAVALLADREAAGGGWNHGNPIVLGVAIPPNALPTAVTLIAIRGMAEELEVRGVGALRRIWRTDTPGPLTLAACAIALEAHGSEVVDVWEALDELVAQPVLDYDAVAWAWIAIAAGRREGILP